MYLYDLFHIILGIIEGESILLYQMRHIRINQLEIDDHFLTLPR